MKAVKILVVEDEPDVCAALEAFFGRRGHCVTATGSGLEALRLAGELNPDLVFLDITLNELNGLEVLRELRRMNSTAKVVILTGQLFSAEKYAEAVRLGVIEVFQKPVSLSRLETLVIQEFTVSEVPRPVPAVPVIVQTQSSNAVNYHKIANLLGMVRMSCEGFILESNEGLHRNMLAAEAEAEAAAVMRNVILKVDEISEHLNHARSANRQ